MHIQTWMSAVLFVTSVCAEGANNEQRLIDNLLKNYTQPSARPVLDDSDTVLITYRYSVTQVTEVDEREQFIVVNGMMGMTWTDHLMVWNASDYGGLDTIKVDKTAIWIPDITLYNNVDTDFEHMKDSIPLSITSDGTVSLASPTIYAAFCKMDVRYFPFDKQVCDFKFGSWTYASHHIDIESVTGEAARQTSFNENGVWDLDDVSFKKNIVKYDCCPDNFSDVTMTIGLSRRYTSYIGNILAPCILLSFLAAFVFYLPAECGEKISFSITNLLAIVLFQQLIAEALPPSDDTPYLASFFTLIISLGCVSVVSTSVILKIHYGRHKKPVNETIQRIIIKGLGSILGVYEPSNHSAGTSVSSLKRNDSVSPYRSVSARILRNTQSCDQSDSVELKEMMEEIRKFNEEVEMRKKEDEITETWINLATVMDKLMLILFMVIVFLATFIVLITLLQNYY
ncbi:neuronal acetylcholine receptor subunit alpha-9-II-like [Antedon mediterranea]|uniref:neuronal acetylcholine receptor subunit alpha-9-II-like n=1 Tax=Antedon mediterranea TaxID=105859 RepID=UPI003AF49374